MILLLLKGILTIFLPLLFWDWGNLFLLAGLVWYGMDYGQMNGLQRGLWIICGILTVINLWMQVKEVSPRHREFAESLGDGLLGAYSKLISIVVAMVLLVISAPTLVYGFLVLGGILLVDRFIVELRLMPEKIRKSKIAVITPGEENLHTLQEFKEELESRKLMAEDGFLYGIDENLEENRRADVLSFSEVPEKKYPAYIYAFCAKDVKGNDTNRQDVPEDVRTLLNSKETYFYVYYVNGQITVVPATYDREFIEVRIRAKKLVFTETNRIYVYDVRENKYKNLAETDGVHIIYSFKDVRGKFEYSIEYPLPAISHIRYTDLCYIPVERVDWENITKLLTEVAVESHIP